MRHLTDNELWDVIDGLASLPEKALRKTHLSDCPGCQARYQTLLTFNGQLSQLPLATPSAMFTDNLIARLEAEAQLQSAAPQKHRQPRTVPLVLSTLLAFMTIIILVLAYQYPSAVPAMPGVAEAIRTGGTVLASKSVLNGMLLANALLLLWLFNQRVLAPFFRNRMIAAEH